MTDDLADRRLDLWNRRALQAVRVYEDRTDHGCPAWILRSPLLPEYGAAVDRCLNHDPPLLEQGAGLTHDRGDTDHLSVQPCLWTTLHGRLHLGEQLDPDVLAAMRRAAEPVPDNVVNLDDRRE